MRWSNLKSFLCPHCAWILDNKETFYKCTGCHYKIQKETFDQIITSMSKPKIKIPTEEENLEALNNFGRTPVPEGFNPEEDEDE